MRNRINLTDEEIEARFDDLGYVTTADGLAYTSDTIANFLEARKGYAKAGEIVTNEDGVLEIRDVQTFKGQPRYTICVVDFGDVRAVYKCPPTPSAPLVSGSTARAG